MLSAPPTSSPVRVRATTRASQPSSIGLVHSVIGKTPSSEPSSVQPSTWTWSRPLIVVCPSNGSARPWLAAAAARA
jgi:hypothetical protein